MIINGREEELKLTYPCNWSYRVICEEHLDVTQIVTEVVDNRNYNLEISNKSKTGKYQSYNIEILVHHDDDRLGLFELFKKHSKIKMVL